MSYPYYRALAAEKTLGIDYDVKNTYGVGDYLVHLAIHGGAMEPPTSQLATYCAGSTGACYRFEALSEVTAVQLLMDPVAFDEPFAVANVANSARTISWRGVDDLREAEEVCYVSGLDDILVALVVQELNAAGFVTDTPPLRFAGGAPANITNRNKNRAGVQLDLTKSLRRSFYADGDLSSAAVSNPANRLPAFFNFGDAIRRAGAQVPLSTPAPDVPPVIAASGPADTGVSVAMRTPFAIDHTGGVDTTQDAREQLLDRVQALVGTLPGERVMRATYGVPTSAALFEVDADAANDQLQRAVLAAVAEFEPSAVVSAIVATVNDAVGLVNIQVQVSRSDTPGAEAETTRTVGVRVGGSVVSTPG